MLLNDEGGSRQKNLLVVCICFLVFIMSLILGNVHYDTNDDAIYNMIAAGAYGEPSQYLIWINIVYGYFLKALYCICPVINWYLWVFEVANFLGITVLCLILTHSFTIVPTITLTAIINYFLYEEFYIGLQFTQNAAFHGIVGLSILLYALYHGKKDKWYRVLATIFVAYGFCLRPLAVAMIVPFFLVPIFREFLRGGGTDNGYHLYSIILPLCQW